MKGQQWFDPSILIENLSVEFGVVFLSGKPLFVSCMLPATVFADPFRCTSSSKHRDLNCLLYRRYRLGRTLRLRANTEHDTKGELNLTAEIPSTCLRFVNCTLPRASRKSTSQRRGQSSVSALQDPRRSTFLFSGEPAPQPVPNRSDESWTCTGILNSTSAGLQSTPKKTHHSIIPLTLKTLCETSARPCIFFVQARCTM